MGPLNPGLAAKQVSDRIWNALGLEACPLFDERGEFNPDAIARLKGSYGPLCPV